MIIKSAPPCHFGCGCTRVVSVYPEWICEYCGCIRRDLDAAPAVCPKCKANIEYEFLRSHQAFGEITSYRGMITRIASCDCEQEEFTEQRVSQITTCAVCEACDTVTLAPAGTFPAHLGEPVSLCTKCGSIRDDLVKWDRLHKAPPTYCPGCRSLNIKTEHYETVRWLGLGYPEIQRFIVSLDPYYVCGDCGKEREDYDWRLHRGKNPDRE